ncbi:thymidine phosphorylase [Alginatibacterium sediminis]|uniref:Thymidine phosphorylase n=1 Tax=Alginatibacterium sediminis TaxID=2164068 RepID=A0A420E8X7_9ALTE|nr:thymidine phosphorylase [Alginatibacterium sediminis]RKF15734.1 thymidine phosphorylase [Alginatibacterium sediminis]
MSLVQELIAHKRNGNILSLKDIQSLVSGISDHSISDAQVGALAMAIYFQGMNTDESAQLTLAMRDSGETISWKDYQLNGPVIDKHSTGGVGDLVSLMLGPMLAACGAYVPMISGRGLGHTGGTLDKLESIAGYNVIPDRQSFQSIVKDVGVAIIGQTQSLAPADKRLYAIRDVTATVDSIPLITASILSKKLAAGLDALVMDVKTGNGAFMRRTQDAQALAKSIVSVSKAAGCPCSAIISDMNQPLIASAGNALEISWALEYLQGQHKGSRADQLTFALATQLLVQCGLYSSAEQAHAALSLSIDSGKAAERFAKMVHALGGPSDLFEKPERYLKTANVVKPVIAQQSGFVTGIDSREIGLCVVALGGGRSIPDAPINHSVGISQCPELGQYIEAGDVLMSVHAQSEDDWSNAAQRAQSAVTVSSSAETMKVQPLVQQIVS